MVGRSRSFDLYWHSRLRSSIRPGNLQASRRPAQEPRWALLQLAPRSWQILFPTRRNIVDTLGLRLCVAVEGDTLSGK